MGYALVKEQEANGVYLEEFEAGLYQIGDHVRIAEQRLTLRVDNGIKDHYLKQKQEIEDMIHQIEMIISQRV